MRTDNRKVKNTVISIYFVLVVFGILLATVFKSFNLFSDVNFYVFIGVFITLVLFHSVAGYFEYDSDGDKVIITNQGLILTDYVNYRQRKLEFTRSQLIGFKIKNYIIYKSLVLVIKNHKGVQTKHRFNITLVKRSSLKYVKQSLTKTLKENRKQKQAE